MLEKLESMVVEPVVLALLVCSQSLTWSLRVAWKGRSNIGCIQKRALSNSLIRAFRTPVPTCFIPKRSPDTVFRSASGGLKLPSLTSCKKHSYSQASPDRYNDTQIRDRVAATYLKHTLWRSPVPSPHNDICPAPIHAIRGDDAVLRSPLTCICRAKLWQ